MYQIIANNYYQIIKKKPQIMTNKLKGGNRGIFPYSRVGIIKIMTNNDK